MEAMGLVFFCLILIIGVVVIPFGVAGTFIIVVDAFIYALFTGFRKITLDFLLILLLLAIAVEVIEFFLGAIAARKYGSSKWGMIGAMIGGILGAVWATPALPLIGTVLGGLLGAFAGATLLEFLSQKDVDRSLRAGLGAFIGGLSAKVIKIAVAVVMTVLILTRIF